MNSLKITPFGAFKSPKRKTSTILKLIALAVCFLSFNNRTIAQTYVQPYSLAITSGVYTPVVGGTGVPVIQVNDAMSGSIPIGFPFSLGNVTYNSLFASSNGFVDFTASGSGSISSASTHVAIYTLAADLTGASGTASYITSGIAPNRVFTMEWKNYQWWTTADAISFQLKLYEGTNAIQFVYNPITTVNGSASAGFSPKNGFYDYYLNNLTSTPSVFSNQTTFGLSPLPASGQTYTFTPGALACNNLMTINGAGGTNATDGLMTQIGGSGVMQIRRAGTGQIHYPSLTPDRTNNNPQGTYNNIALAVGNSVLSSVNNMYTTSGPTTIPWTIVSNSCQSSIDAQTGGIQKDTLQLQGIIGGLTYGLRLIYTYTYPKEYINIDYQVTIPPGNTKIVKLSHGITPLFIPSPNTTASGFVTGTAPNLIVGLTTTGKYNAFRYNNGLAWTNYYAAYYSIINQRLDAGGDLNNLISTDISNNYNKSIGFQVNMGSTPGVYTINNDYITSSSSAVLPVSLLSFDATKNNNKGATLSWATASEHNSAYFDAERSEDGKNYRSIGKVTANGNTNTEKSYKLDDTKPVAGMNYYRLKTVDVDGKSEYSPVRILNFGANANIIIYPNPAETEVTVAGVETGMHVNILGMDGRTIVSYPVTGNKLDVSLKSIQSGLYILQVRGKNGEVISSQKLMKK
jgi:hypothetical protein